MRGTSLLSSVEKEKMHGYLFLESKLVANHILSRSGGF